MRVTTLLCCLFACGSASPSAVAGTVAATFSNILPPEGNNLARAVGWEFAPSVDIEVTRLGVFDSGDLGLLDPHDVALYSGGNALAAVQVPAGESADLVEGSRFIDLDAPVRLDAGTTYLLLANNWSNDEYVFDESNFIDEVGYDSVISWQAGVVGDDNSVSPQVTDVLADSAFLGPNLVFEVIELLVGDYSGDGSVGIEDYNEWLASVGSQGPGLATDGNGDGLVDAADYTVWRDAFAAAAVGARPVPEPATGLLLLVAGLSMSSRER